MKCKEVQKLLPSFQRELLDAEMTKLLSDHLASCESCQETLALEQRVSEHLDAVFREEADSAAAVDIAEIVLKRSHSERVSTYRGHTQLKLVYRFGAAAATVVLVLWLPSLFRNVSPVIEIGRVQEAPVRTAFLPESPVRIPEVRDVQRKSTVTKLKENVVWISYTN
jgi:anti-sigma factor RsiW